MFAVCRCTLQCGTVSSRSVEALKNKVCFLLQCTNVQTLTCTPALSFSLSLSLFLSLHPPHIHREAPGFLHLPVFITIMHGGALRACTLMCHIWWCVWLCVYHTQPCELRCRVEGARWAGALRLLKQVMVYYCLWRGKKVQSQPTTQPIRMVRVRVRWVGSSSSLTFAAPAGFLFFCWFVFPPIASSLSRLQHL